MAFTQGVAQTIHLTTLATSDHFTPTQPTTPVVTISTDGGATYGAPTNSVATTAYGISLVLATTETNRAAVLVRCTSANCDPVVGAFYFEDAWTTARAGALPDVEHGLAGGLPVLDSNLQVQADLAYAHGAALTEAGGHGRLAAAISTFGNVATPAFTAADAMRGTDSAALASAWTDTRAGYLDQLNGATDGTLCEIVKTCLTELSNRTNNSSLHDLLGVPDTAGHTVLTDLPDAVWDEATAGHTTAGSFGVWATGLVAAVWAYATRTLTSWGTLLGELSTTTLSGLIGGSQNVSVYYGDNTPWSFTIASCPGTVTAITLAIVRKGSQKWDDAVVNLTSETSGGITITNAATGSATFTFTSTQLEDLLPRDYRFSIKVTIGGTRRTALTGNLLVMEAQDAVLDAIAAP